MKLLASPAPLPRCLASALWALPLTGGVCAAESPAAPPSASAQEPAKAAPAESPAEETAAAAASEEASTAEASEPKNWIEFGVGGTFFSGRRAAYQQRSGQPESALGGVERLHYEHPGGGEGRFQVDGRGIFDNHDYALSFDLNLPDQGFVRFGYREFRQWSDPAGGWFPPTQGWYDLYSGTLAYDERQFRVEAGLRLPKVPQLTLRYSHREREGQKDSTLWGPTSQTGGRGPRSIVPTVLNLDRVRDLVMADLAHTLAGTRVGVGFRYERQDNDEARWIRRFPGEGPANDRLVTQRDRTTADLFGAHATTQTPLGDKFKFTAAYGYTDLNSDLAGYRAFGSVFDPDFAQRYPAIGTYDRLAGGALLRQHVGNLNLLAQLTDRLVLVASVRIENRQTDSEAFFDAPAAPFSPSAYAAASERRLLDVSEALEARFTGLTNWVFYARGWWLQGNGDLDERLDNRSTTTAVLFRSTDDHRHAQKYTVGANWYPRRRLSLGAEYYHKIRENDYDHGRDLTPNGPDSINRLPAYLRAQDFTTDDVNFRVTWRPRANLTLVGRYDLQLSQIETRADLRAGLESAELTSHIGSGSLSWAPWARLYLLGSFSYVFDRAETPASSFLSAVQNAENDYWTGQLTLGLACDDRTDLEAQYVYYRADNYADNSQAGQPYGAGAEEHGLTLGLVRRLSPRVQVAFRYGFFTSHDTLAGGRRDYDAHGVYSTLRYRF